MDGPLQASFPAGPRYTLYIKFTSAANLPAADIPSLLSDPYIVSTLRFPGTELPKLHYRTRTIRSTLSPHWEETWGVSNVPVSGATVKIKVLDEDPGGHRDRLGVVTVSTDRLDVERNMLINETKTLGAGRGAWVGLLRAVTLVIGRGGDGRRGEVKIEIRVEEMAAEAERLEDRAFTVFPNRWSQHFSPLIGIITHTKSSTSSGNGVGAQTPSIQHFTFAATKMQLTGPVPAVMNHRYVAFRPIIKTFYTKRGLLGVALNRALKHQYRTIYSYDKATAYGMCETLGERAQKLLEFTHWGEGGRIYTYVITLDSEWRFTETGKEFGIQMLSKHTMHSGVSINVAFAGEFFVRALPGTKNENPHSRRPSCSPADYELVIDNDSGTYRPPKEHIPALRDFLVRSLPGLHIRAVDAFDQDHIRMKAEHVAAKARRGGSAGELIRRFKQPSSSGEDNDSSSDEEELKTGRIGLGRRMKRKMWRKVERSGDLESGSSGSGDEARKTRNGKRRGRTERSSSDEFTTESESSDNDDDKIVNSRRSRLVNVGKGILRGRSGGVGGSRSYGNA